MDLWKGYELSRTYVPAAYYTITSIKSKNGRANPLHDEVLGRKAYVVYLEVSLASTSTNNVRSGLPALLITIRKFTWAGTRSRKKQSWLG